MASKTSKRSICLLNLALFSIVHSFMDIEELQSINYGINILKEPIVIPETHPDSAILVTSRHGQQYQCNYPTHQEQRQQKEEEEKIALETGVVELLKPMAQAPCLMKTKDWWTYELCYGKYIRQYHVEDGYPSGSILYLGHYQSDFDWDNETLRDARVRSKIASGRYHSQYYTNGSKCDLTGKGRETEVRYLCEEAEDDYIVRVDEPETCVYVITVHSPRICRHPHLKSPTPTQPIPIVCVPLLTDQQYLQYQMHTEAMRQKEEEAKAKARVLQEQREREQALAEAQKEDADIEDDLADSVNSILKKSLGKEVKFKGRSADQSLAAMEEGLPTGWKVMKDLDDLGKLLDPQGILSNMDMSSKGQSSQSAKASAGEEGTKSTAAEVEDSVHKLREQEEPEEGHRTVEGQIDDAIDDELNEFEKEVKTLRERQAMTQKRLQQIKERVKKAVTSQFQDIIDEAEAELGSEVNEDLALSQLAKSLNSLMEKLENTEKEMKDMDREISNIAASTKLAEAEAPPGEEEGQEPEGGQTEGEEPKGGVQAPPNTRHATAAVKGDAGEGRWKMKVRTVMREELEQDSKAKLPPSKHQKHLESSLKDELEKAGVDPNSVKVHVRVIGAVSTNSDDDDTTLHVLSEEESATFQNMIVAILGGSNEAVKEQKRQSSLEDSYNFVFSQTVGQDAAAPSTTHAEGDDIMADDDEGVSSDDAALGALHADGDGASDDDVSSNAAPTLPKEEL